MEANFYLSYYDWRKKKHCKNCAKRETSDVTVVLTRLFPPPPSLASCSSSSPHLCLNICVFLSCLCQSQEKHFCYMKENFFFLRRHHLLISSWQRRCLCSRLRIGVCVCVRVICKGVWLNTYEAAMMKGIIRVHLFSVWFLHSLTQRGVYCFSGGNQLKEET